MKTLISRLLIPFCIGVILRRLMIEHGIAMPFVEIEDGN